MRIYFENWLENNDIPTNAMELFKEAIICYKVSAYRSAFIMSYIGFQNILKKRILDASYIPNGVNPTLWQRICSDMGKDDLWDNTVVDCVRRNTPDRIFLISSAVVTQYDAFRTIRNICAHGKNGTISYYHVEHFWGFIQENYHNFVVNGGKSGIIQMIERHYDKTITPPNKNVSYIVENIKLGILDQDLTDFLNEFYQLCKLELQGWQACFGNRNRMIDLWDKLVYESDARIHNEVIQFVKSCANEDICDFVDRYPPTVDEILTDAAFARKLWSREIFSCPLSADGTWLFLKKIIDNNMVPDAEKENFDKELYKFIGRSFPKKHKELLLKTTYFDRLKRVLFDRTQYNYPNGIEWANSIINSFLRYVHEFGLDKESVGCINIIFSFANYGSFYDGICGLMKKDTFLNSYKDIVIENGMQDYSGKFELEE